jgi:hypothetical protein
MCGSQFSHSAGPLEARFFIWPIDCRGRFEKSTFKVYDFPYKSSRRHVDFDVKCKFSKKYILQYLAKIENFTFLIFLNISKFGQKIQLAIFFANLNMQIV